MQYTILSLHALAKGMYSRLTAKQIVLQHIQIIIVLCIKRTRKFGIILNGLFYSIN